MYNIIDIYIYIIFFYLLYEILLNVRTHKKTVNYSTCFIKKIINKEVLELENMEKMDEIKKIQQFDKGEVVENDEEIIDG